MARSKKSRARAVSSGNVPGGIGAMASYQMMPVHQIAQAYEFVFATLTLSAWHFQICVRNVSVQTLFSHGFTPEQVDGLQMQQGAMEFILHPGKLAAASEAELIHLLIRSNAPRVLVPTRVGRDLCKSLTGAHWDTRRMNQYASLMVRP